jgi:tight adherence protein C
MTGVTAMVVTGGLIGGLLVLLVLLLVPPRPAAIVQLGRFDADRRSGTRPAASLALAGLLPDLVPELAPEGGIGPGSHVTRRAGQVQERLGQWVATELDRRRVSYTRLRQDLHLTGRSFEAVLGLKLLTACAGTTVVLIFAAGVRIGAGATLPPVLVALFAGLAAVVLWFLPDVDARREAAARRRDFRHAMGVWLDLVALEMAGSAAPAEAVPNAARVGDGWPMAMLRLSLFRATRSGRDHWDALTELGDRVGIPDLRDLGGLIRLVGRDGARVRQTLMARAATMRRRELAEAQGVAGEREQYMRIAQILIAFGFIIFIGYAGVMNVLAF